MFKKKSQSSLEFMMIFGIGFVIIIMLSGIFFTYFNSEKQSLDHKHLENIGNEIIMNVEKIYFLGNGNRVTINTNFPEGIQNITIKHYENVNINGKNTSFDYLFITTVENETMNFNPYENYIRFNCVDCEHRPAENISFYNDTSIFSGGNKKIRIESKGDLVELSFIRE